MIDLQPTTIWITAVVSIIQLFKAETRLWSPWIIESAVHEECVCQCKCKINMFIEPIWTSWKLAFFVVRSSMQTLFLSVARCHKSTSLNKQHNTARYKWTHVLMAFGCEKTNLIRRGNTLIVIYLVCLGVWELVSSIQILDQRVDFHWGISRGFLPGGVLLNILGGGVPHSSQNPDPISDQNVWFFRPFFRPAPENLHPFSNLSD